MENRFLKGHDSCLTAACITKLYNPTFPKIQ